MLRVQCPKFIFGLALTLLLLSLLSACSSVETQTPSGEPVVLRIAVLRIMDALPMYVADSQGYFVENNIKVEFLPVVSAPERDQLIASGQADGMINEVMSTLFSNREQTTIQIVRIARAADEQHPVFRILAGKDSGVEGLDGLTAVETGISEGTIIEYLMDRLVEAEGYSREDFPKVNIPSIPDRLALLNGGELKAAMLPDPFSLLALQSGAVVVIDDSSHPEYGYSTIAFRKEFVDQYPEAIQAFLAAVEKAVGDINLNPDQWKGLLTDRELVPAPLIETYQISPFPAASVPSEQQFQDALDWAKSAGLLNVDISYSDTVNAQFLP